MDPGLAGSPALRAVARLHRLVDLFGEAEVLGSELTEGEGGAVRLEARLAFRAGGSVTLIEERLRGLGRRTEWDLICERGRLGSPPAGSAGSLFREDLEHFVRRIVEGADSYVSEERVVHVLELVEAIETGYAGAASAVS